MGLLRRHRTKDRDTGLSTSTPNKGGGGGGDTSRSLSVKSTPGQQQKTLSSPLNPMRISYDVGNRTEPALAQSRASSPSRKQGGWRQKTYITPDINPVRHRQPKGIFSIKRDNSNNSSSDEEQREDYFGTSGTPSIHQNGNKDGLATGVPSLDNIPLAKNGTAVGSQYSFQASLNTHNSPSVTTSNAQLSESLTEQDPLEKPNKETLNHSGLFSTFISAAHTAASHIGSITGTKSHTEHDDVNTSTNSNSNFIQHLDTLLSLSGSKKNTLPSPTGTVKPDDDRLDSVSQTSKSNAHDVKFEPLRKTIMGTMGKGELRLEDLGFSTAQTNLNGSSAVLNQMGPQIELHPSSDPASVTKSPMVSPKSEIPPLIPVTELFDTNSKAPQPPPLTSTLSSSSQLPNSNLQIPLEQLQNHGHSSRSLSPPAFKRSLSPTLNRTTDAKMLTVPRRSHSTNGHDRFLNDDLSFDTALSQSSSIDLKNVTFTNSKRDAEFHSVFKKLPKSERLIDDFSCALQRELSVQGRMLISEKILVQGRMYISEKYISFKSNILGWVTALSIPIQEIVQLEKKNTAGVFPNAIVIQTLHQKYIFASFLQRDVTFDLITNIWNQIVRGSMGEDDDTVSHEDFGRGRGRARTMSFGSRARDSNSDDYSEDDEYDSEGTLSDFDDDNDDTKSTTDQAQIDSDVPNISKHAPTEPQHSETPGEVKITEQIIQAPLPKTFSLLFGKDTEFFKKVIAKQKNINISEVPGFQEKDGSPTREYHYTKPLSGPVGPKEATCYVVETLDHKDFQDYILCTQNTKTPDVPSGNSFSTVTYIYLSWGPKNSTKVTVYTYMKWTAKSWIRGAIDKGSIDGQKESIAILVDELRSKVVSEAPSSGGSTVGNVSSLPLVGPKTHPAANFKPNVPSPESIITEEVLQAPLGTVYSLLMNPDYLKQILVAQKMIDISSIPPFPEFGERKRSYTYVKPLNNPIGPKSTKCNVTDTIEHYDLDSYIQVTRIVTTPEVPSGGSFYVSTNFWLSWGENNSTKVVISTGVVWKGKSWLKSTIEKGSIDGQKEGNVLMMKEVKSIIAKDAAGGKRRRGTSVIKRKPSSKDEEQAFLDRIGAPKKGYRFTFPGLPSDSPLGSLFLLFIVAVTAWVSIGLLNGGGGGGRPLMLNGGVNKVMIGGQEYIIMPSVDSLVEDPKEKMEKEYNIWKWIESRTDKSQSSTDDVKGKENMAAVMKAHKEQDLREMLHIAESHLAELLQQLDEKTSDASTVTLSGIV